MARPLRIEYPGAVYHVTSRGNAANGIFVDDRDRENFLATLGLVVRRFNWLCHAYCLMGNHYHLLIETPEGNLSKGMRQLNGVYTQVFNRRYRRVGHILQGRFKAILVERESYLLEVSRYVVLNSVRANWVKRPELWKWSSYGATAGFRKPPDFLTVDWLLGQFSTKRREAQERYREFVIEGMKRPSPWDEIRGQIFLGRGGFMEEFKNLLSKSEDIEEIPRLQRYASRPALDEVFSGMGKWDRKERDLRIYNSYVMYGYTLKEIAQYLGIHYTTVSKAVRGLESESEVQG